MRRTRMAALAVLIFSASSAAGCIPVLLGGGTRYGEWYANDVDVARAQAVWRDPWVAPDMTLVAHVQTKGLSLSRHGVLRTVASRATSVPPEATAPQANLSLIIVLKEVAAATSAGWQLTGATCSQPPFEVSARLRRPGDTLDGAATATVSTSSITVVVPHHLDTDWAFEKPVELAATCLAGGLSTRPPEGAGVTGSETTVPAADEPRWDTDFPAPGLAGPLATLSADPVMTALGITVYATEKPLGWQIYRTAGGFASVAGSIDHAVRAVSSIPSQWKPTFVACWGANGQRVVQFQRELEPGRYAVLDLRDRSTKAVVNAGVQVSTPGISLDAGSGVSLADSCLTTGATSAVSGSSAAFTAVGSPANGPTQLQPIFGRTNKP